MCDILDTTVPFRRSRARRRRPARSSLSMRKTNLDRLLARRPDGIFVAPFEQGEIGPDLFRAACDMGLEGLVSKHRDRPYQGGRSKHWVKMKNRKHPAMSRVMEARLANHVSNVGISPEGLCPCTGAVRTSVARCGSRL